MFDSKQDNKESSQLTELFYKLFYEPSYAWLKHS